MDPVSALLAGVVAGLAIAVPLGAIGVLLITEGIRRGHASAAAAAFGVASVDLAYATLALLAGSLVTALLAGHERPVTLAAALVLLAIGVHGLVTSLRSPSFAPVAGQESKDGRSLRSAYWRFVGLTAVNPLTALYFIALAAGLGGRIEGAAHGSLFVIGIFTGSLAWQLVLGLGGAALGPRLGPGVRRATAAIGYGVVILLSGAVAANALTA